MGILDCGCVHGGGDGSLETLKMALARGGGIFCHTGKMLLPSFRDASNNNVTLGSEAVNLKGPIAPSVVA